MSSTAPFLDRWATLEAISTKNLQAACNTWLEIQYVHRDLKLTPLHSNATTDKKSLCTRTAKGLYERHRKALLRLVECIRDMRLLVGGRIVKDNTASESDKKKSTKWAFEANDSESEEDEKNLTIDMIIKKESTRDPLNLLNAWQKLGSESKKKNDDKLYHIIPASKQFETLISQKKLCDMRKEIILNRLRLEVQSYESMIITLQKDVFSKEIIEDSLKVLEDLDTEQQEDGRNEQEQINKQEEADDFLRKVQDRIDTFHNSIESITTLWYCRPFSNEIIDLDLDAVTAKLKITSDTKQEEIKKLERDTEDLMEMHLKSESGSTSKHVECE